jgi:hypothetical protein
MLCSSDEGRNFSDCTTEIESVAHSKYSCLSVRKSSISSYFNSISSGNDASDGKSVFSTYGKCPLLLISSSIVSHTSP